MAAKVICERRGSLSKAIVMYVGISVSLTCFVLRATRLFRIKPLTGTCHLHFGPLQGGSHVWDPAISSLCSQSDILPGGSQRCIQTGSNSSVSCRGARLWFVFNSVQMLVWECARWGLPLKFPSLGSVRACLHARFCPVSRDVIVVNSIYSTAGQIDQGLRWSELELQRVGLHKQGRLYLNMQTLTRQIHSGEPALLLLLGNSEKQARDLTFPCSQRNRERGKTETFSPIM